MGSNTMPLFLKTFFAALLIVLYGCGGGSSGTDGGVSIRLSGTVSDGSGAPLNGLSVTVLETGDSGATNEAGNYNLPTTFVGNTMTLLVSDGSKESRAVVRDLELVEGDVVDIDLTLSQSEFTVSIVSVVVNEPVPSQPTPTPKPEATPQVQKIAVNGKLKLPDGRPVRGFKVSIVGERSSDVTDRNGGFSVTASKRTVTLLIENAQDKAEIKLPSVSANTRTITVELAVLVALPSGNDIGALALLPFEVALAQKPSTGR